MCSAEVQRHIENSECYFPARKSSSASKFQYELPKQLRIELQYFAAVETESNIKNKWKMTRKNTSLENTLYEFTLDDGSKVKVKGNEEIEYDGEVHTAANLFDALKEGTYGKY